MLGCDGFWLTGPDYSVEWNKRGRFGQGMHMVFEDNGEEDDAKMIREDA